MASSKTTPSQVQKVSKHCGTEEVTENKIYRVTIETNFIIPRCFYIKIQDTLSTSTVEIIREKNTETQKMSRAEEVA